MNTPIVPGLSEPHKRDPIEMLVALMKSKDTPSAPRLRGIVSELEDIAKSDPRVSDVVLKAIEAIESGGRDQRKNASPFSVSALLGINSSKVQTPI